MDTSRKLEDISSNLDDMSLTLEEIKDAVQENDTADTKKLDELQRDVHRAADAIEEVVDPDQPPRG